MCYITQNLFINLHKNIIKNKKIKTNRKRNVYANNKLYNLFFIVSDNIYLQ